MFDVFGETFLEAEGRAAPLGFLLDGILDIKGNRSPQIFNCLRAALASEIHASFAFNIQASIATKSSFCCFQFKLRLPPVSELRSLQYASFDRFRDSRKSKFVTASLAAGQLPKLRYSSVRYSGFDAFNNSASIAFNDQASFASNLEL